MLAFLCSALLWSFPARAADCPSECQPEPACQKKILDCLLAAGESRGAVEHFKKLAQEKPEAFEYQLYLARAYQADGNTPWARRTLVRALEENPENCTVRAWLAWLEIGQGELDAAEEALTHENCPESPADEGRWMLLRAVIAEARQDAKTAQLVEQLGAVEVFYRGDDELWRSLRARYLPGFPPPVELRLENAWGFTTNARAGAPADPDSRGAKSLIGRLDAYSRLAWPMRGWIRPALEAGLKAHGIGAEKEREFSYLELSARPGVILGGFPRAFVGYHVDYLVLARDTEAERRFFEGHRAELDLEIDSFTFFAGFGRRIFHESGRTRFELDGGIGGSFALSERFSLLAAAAARYYQARGEPYDLVGGTLLASGRMRFQAGLYGRLLLSLGYDDYFNSGGALGLLAYGSESRRRDFLAKAGMELWSPAVLGARAGLGYEFSWRNSSLDGSNSTEVYDYTEHRLMIKLRWEFSWDFSAPRTEPPPADLALVEGGESALGSERIQDLLRQDEAARRGSSCAQ